MNQTSLTCSIDLNCPPLLVVAPVRLLYARVATEIEIEFVDVASEHFGDGEAAHEERVFVAHALIGESSGLLEVSRAM